MTQRLKGATVCFDSDIRVDDAEEILKAIRMIRGVADVVGAEASSDDWLARTRVRSELLSEIIKLFK